MNNPVLYQFNIFAVRLQERDKYDPIQLEFFFSKHPRRTVTREGYLLLLQVQLQVFISSIAVVT